MALRYVDRLGVLIVIGGGLLVFQTMMPILEAQTPAPRQTAPAPADRNAASLTTTGAPAPADRNAPSVTVTGCLLLGPYGDYTLSKTIVATGAVLNAVAWKLEGGNDLLGHVLEKVEVTGTMQPAPSPAVVTASNRPADRNQAAASYRLRVKTIKKVVGGCS